MTDDRTAFRRKPTAIYRILTVLAFLALPAGESARAGDKDFGEYLSSQCTTCHQRSGKATGIPSIVGWDAESFVAVMQAYKKKERDNKVMQSIAASLSADDIAALAAYFGSLKPQD